MTDTNETSDTGAPGDDGPAAYPYGAWERRTKTWALTLAAVTLLTCAVLVWAVQPAQGPIIVGILLIPPIVMYRWQTKRVRRRRAILSEPFPARWEAALQQNVVFFRTLDADGQRRFRQDVQVFLGEKRITGIGAPLDTTTHVLVGASAVIPIFGFPDWEWNQINEVLVYPNRFDGEFQFGDKRGHDILGMVGTGSLNRVMILSQPDLLSGFRNATDKRNVGIHEFAHLVDKSDGTIDGVPGAALAREAVGPWVDLVRRKMAEIEARDSDIHRYALTSESEFFAVASEYFFARPGLMQRKHPKLYEALERVFNQDLRSRTGAWRRELGRERPAFGRNAPCPCGSGKKFKKCCLKV